MQRLIVGDIHGCYDELQALLDKAGLCSDDAIVALGDIVDRGPDTPRVLQFFRNTPFATSLMGNHERKHILSYRGRIRPALSQTIARMQIGEAAYLGAVEFMAGFPIYLELPEALLIHGFFEPGVPLGAQLEEVLCGVMSGEQRILRVCSRPWYEMYDGDKPLVAGHHDYSREGKPMVIQASGAVVYCIDTGCCYGRNLTGLLLPDFRLISVPGRRNYWTELKGAYAELRISQTRDLELAWPKIEELLMLPHRRPDLAPEVRYRLERLSMVLDQARSALEALFNAVADAYEHTMRELRADIDFNGLPERDQSRLFAERIAKSPLKHYLYEARKGRFQMDSLKRRLKSPGEAIDLAVRLGLIARKQDGETTERENSKE